MFSEGGIEGEAARVSVDATLESGRKSSPDAFSSSSESASASASLPASIGASRVIMPLLLAEAAAFALATASGKIPAFLFTAVRALLTF